MLVILLFVLVLLTHFRSGVVRFSIPPTTLETIPRTIVLTNKDKARIPTHIYDQYKKHAKDYTLSVFDDQDCEAFLRREYPYEVIRTFRSLRTGAHKADLFRYAYLYKCGGVYLDVKTILLKDLEDIIDHDRPVFYVVYTDQNRLYNGILCTPPRNEYFLRLLEDMVYGPSISHYMQVCESAARVLKQEMSGNLQKGPRETRPTIPDVHLWKEIFCNADKHCKGKRDRYGFCNYCIDEHDTKLFKIRDDSYGKGWK